MTLTSDRTYIFRPPPPEPFSPASHEDHGDWQLEDIEYLASRDWSANWSEMGCYKTSTVLWVIERKLAEVKNPRVLIVTSKAGKGTYYDAVPRVLPGWNIYSVTAQGEGKVDLMIDGDPVRMHTEFPFAKESPEPLIILATYSAFLKKSQILPLFKSTDYDFIVLDEAHRIKEKDTQWTKELKRLRSPFKHVMTGTGFINRPDEMWSLLNFLNPRIFSSYWTFRKHFVDEYRDEEKGYKVILGVKPERLEEFRAMRKTVGPRRVKNGPHGVFEGELEEPIVTPYYVLLNPTQRRMYDEIKQNLATLDQQGVPIYSPNVLSQLNRLRQICVATPKKVRDYYDEKLDRRVQEIELIEPSSKLDAVMDILDGMEWDDEYKQQVVIFSNFKDPLKLLARRLDNKKIPYLHMLAEHDDEERYRLWHDEFPKKNHRVFMATLQLGSESINLTSADTAIFLDRSWSPKDNEQGVGRIYRPGQTRVPQIIHINARNTTDQRVERTNKIKLGWFNEIFGDDEDDS